MIVLHIGYPKTATTSIQILLENFTNVLTQYSKNKYANVGINILTKRVLNNSPDDWYSDAGLKDLDIIQQVWHALNKNNITIHSDERLLRPFFFAKDAHHGFQKIGAYDFPIVKHLESILDINPNIMPIKIIVTLRNQPDWLASRYAQDSNRIPRPSQDDFENRVQNILNDTTTRGLEFINYYKLINDLATLVGYQNVFPLFFEDINTKNFWQEFLQVVNINLSYDKILEYISKKKFNVARTDISQNIWKLRSSKANNFNHEDSFNSICLTQEMFNKITYHCNEHNMKLGNMLNRNLSYHGY